MFQRNREPYTPSEKTPLPSRRLSIENCPDKSVNREDKSGVKSPLLLPRSRRLSLEGPKSIKKDGLQYEPVSMQKYRPMQDVEAVSKLNGQFSSGNSKSELHAKTPRSPTSISYQTRLIKLNDGMQVHPIKLPQTPEPPVRDGNDVHASKVMGSTNGKGSQIRRSLRTIGKLINGPDKRCVLTVNLYEKFSIRSQLYIDLNLWRSLILLVSYFSFLKVFMKIIHM